MFFFNFQGYSPIEGYSKVISKTNCKSLIWGYFGLPANENGEVVCNVKTICRICANSVSSKGGNTTNMIYHLKSHHRSEYLEMKKQSRDIQSSSRNDAYEDEDQNSSVASMEEIDVQFSLDHLYASNMETNVKQEMLEDGSESLDSVTESIIKFLAYTMQSWDLVEEKAFVNMIQNLNPDYEIPEKDYLIKTGVPKLYNDTIRKMKREMIRHLNENFLAITLDSWTCLSDSQYFAVTAHFIDKEWNLKSVYLNCASLDTNYTDESLDHVLMVLLSDWGININQNIISCTTTDKYSKVLRIVDDYCTKLQYIPCFGNCINMAVTQTLNIPPIKIAVSKLKKLQSAIALGNHIKAGHHIIVDGLPNFCPNFWRSTLELTRWFLSNQPVVSAWLQGVPNQKHLVLDGSNISALGDFVSCTKLLDDIATTLCGDEYVSASSVLPLLGKIKKNLQFQASDSALSQEIKSEILSALSKSYENAFVQQDLWMASLCDPRFRLTFTDNAEYIKKMAIDGMIEYYTSNNSSEEQGSQNKEGLEAFFDVTDNESPEQKAKSELHCYLTMNKVNWNSNPLTWWKQHEDSFPALKKIAQKYLAIQGSNVAAERLFGMKGDVVLRQRAALVQENSEMQFFLAENYNFIPDCAC